MSNSPVVPKEKQSAYQRWELHTLEALPGAKNAAPNAAAVEAEKVRHIHQQAFEAGRVAGVREGTQKMAQEAVQLQALLTAAEQQAHEINQRIAQDVLELALEVARQMVSRSLAVHPELVLSVIRDALTRVAPTPVAAAITLNPADAALVREHLSGELAAGAWRIIEDAKVQRGGALLQTAATQIDATLQSRWAKLAAALGQDGAWIV